MKTNTKLMIAMALVVMLAGLGGYNLKSMRTVSKPPRESKPPALPVRQPLSTPFDEQVPMVPPAPVAPVPEPTRAETTRALRERGATVNVALFNLSSLTSPTIGAKAKEYFELTDDEGQKLQEAFTQRIKELGDVALQHAVVQSNDGQTLRLTVPAEPGKAVMDLLNGDVAQILGHERGQEFMEMGANEFPVLLRGGQVERNLTVKRQASPVEADNSAGATLFQVEESLGKGRSLGGRYDPSKTDGPYDWLSKFSGDLSSLSLPASGR
jgi:hypothetical protein